MPSFASIEVTGPNPADGMEKKINEKNILQTFSSVRCQTPLVTVRMSVLDREEELRTDVNSTEDFL